MSDDKVRDALAEVLSRAPETTRTPRYLADRILASGVLATIKADAWDEGWLARADKAPGDFFGPNPYRAEGSA